ncbi:hypothetical protein [Hymenobacter wooponensis]|uniref:Uncharacterized protein n=1 Tax=Hymenobacter wooponensis TaxID=1525360 RepID=A0A4Z0MJ32_9BACT|nr:hypothetical protein [Hymenobacter wooponensis]TGD79554.1 hypothetical protein EU557_15130 [Hymenobacter wooponensis]
MEPNESANPTNEAGNDQAQHNAQPSQPSGADNQGAAANGSAGQQSSDGKSWTEYANVQKVVEQLPQGVRDFLNNSWSQVGKSLGQAGDQVNKLTTTQKVAGAVALAGIGYLALRSGKSSKSSGMGSMYRGDSSKGSNKSQKGYRSGSGSYSSASYNSYSAPSGSTDESSRLDRGPGHYSSFDRQNESRVGGSYQSGSGNSSAGSGSQSSFGSSSSAGNQSSSSNRSEGYRGTSGKFSDSEESDFGSGV